MLIGSLLTNELQEAASGDVASDIIGAALGVSTEQAMDPLLFSNAPATAAAPPGLLNGGTAIPSAGTSGLAGIADDIAALAGAISAAGSNADSMVIVTRAALAAKARILVSPKFTNEILSSPHCPGQ